jgi:negative regulator of sigma E activity
MVMVNFKAGFGAESSGPTAPTPEEISLLIDGELEPVRADAVVTSLCRAEGLATWVCYHVIGDAVRGVASRGLDSRRFIELFAAEPTVLAPPRRSPAPHAIALALAATVAAVSVVGWVALTTMPTPVAAIASARQAVGVRAADARPAVDNEYVLVHQEYSPTNAIQGIGPYLRAVAATEPDARR